jgi:hypothetical protein
MKMKTTTGNEGYMKEKFTPGEWKVSGYKVVLSETPCNKRCSGYGCDNDFICDLDDGEYHEYYDPVEMNANATLIAAAPDMYRMLEQLHGALKSVPILQGEIEEVLKRARGEE